MDLSNLLTFLLDLANRYRKGIVALVVAAVTTALAAGLGPVGAATAVAAVTALAVVLVPNADTDGDGHITLEELADKLVGVGLDAAATEAAKTAVERALVEHPAIPYTGPESLAALNAPTTVVTVVPAA